MICSSDWKTKLDSQLSRMNCQMFSVGLSSGERGGRGRRVTLAGIFSLSVVGAVTVTGWCQLRVASSFLL